MITSTIEGWAPELLRIGTILLQVIIIILIGMQLAKLVRKILKNTLSRTELDAGISNFLISVLNVAMYTLIILMAAERLGIPSTSILAVLGSAGLAIGLALQGSLSNFAGSIVILLMRPFTIGDYIIFSGGEGTVKNIGLVYTTLSTGDNRSVSIPNGTLYNTTVTNVTHQDKRRVDISVGISYNSDLKVAKEIVEELLISHPLVLKDEAVTVFVSELADSAVVIGGRAWTATGDYWTVKWAVTEQVKLRFDERGIEIPFQQLDVHVKNNDAKN